MGRGDGGTGFGSKATSDPSTRECIGELRLVFHESRVTTLPAHCSLCVLTKDRTPNQRHLTLAPRFNANPIIVRVHCEAVAVLRCLSDCARLIGKTTDPPQRRDARAIHRRGAGTHREHKI
jgi:hypothetical protein